MTSARPAAVLTPDDLAQFDDLTDGELLRLRDSHVIGRARARTPVERKRHDLRIARIDAYRERRRR